MPVFCPASRFLVGAKTQKLLVNFKKNLTPQKFVGAKTDVQMTFQGFTEIQNGRHKSTSISWWAEKIKKLVWSIFLNFNITFLGTCGCANDFLKMLPKLKMAARSQP